VVARGDSALSLGVRYLPPCGQHLSQQLSLRTARNVTRLGQLELLALLTSGSDASSSRRFLDSLHAQFWRTVLSWCFDSPNNSVLQARAFLSTIYHSRQLVPMHP
jgi:hypothetical protein